MVQNVFTVAKVAALLGTGGCRLSGGPQSGRPWPATSMTSGAGADWSFTTIRLVGVAMVGSLFSSDAWNNVTFTAGEVRNPRRNLPLSLALGVGIVSALYIACNFVYLTVLTLRPDPERRRRTASPPLPPVRCSDRCGASLMAAAIMVSTFGCVQRPDPGRRARLLRDGAWTSCSSAAPASSTPNTTRPSSRSSSSASGPCCSRSAGSYNDLLDYVIFAVLLFYILTIAGLFVLRRTRPDTGSPLPRRWLSGAARPVHAGCGSDRGFAADEQTRITPCAGLILVLLGVPVYFLWRRKAEPTEPYSRPNRSSASCAKARAASIS